MVVADELRKKSIKRTLELLSPETTFMTDLSPLMVIDFARFIC